MPTLAQKRRAVVMTGNSARLSVELRERPPRSPGEILDVLKAIYDGGRTVGPIAKLDIQRNLRDVVFEHIRSCATTVTTSGSDFTIRSIFKLALDHSSEQPSATWIPIEIFEREHERLLRTPRFLALVVHSGFSQIVHPTLAKVRSNIWTPEERRSFIYEHDQNDVTAFVHAIRRGDIDSVKAIIAFCAERDKEVYYVDKGSQKKVHLLDKQDGVKQATPLHEAIHLLCRGNVDASTVAKNQAFSIIRHILEARSQTLCHVNGSGDPPYSYAVKGGVDEQVQAYLKDAIFSRLDPVVRIKVIPFRPLGNNFTISLAWVEKELYLDLSDFNHSSHDFDLFVRDLTKYVKPGSVAGDLEFEKTLLYVTLPDMQLQPQSNNYGTIGNVFDWLRTMQVDTIKELNIPDRRVQPLTEDFVYHGILKHFRVKELNWRKLDMDISILKRPKTVESLTGLKLYSSGSWSVLYHWASEDGVRSLTEVSAGVSLFAAVYPNRSIEKLESLSIEIVKPSISMGDEAQTRHHDRARGLKEMLEGTIVLKDQLRPKVTADAEWPNTEPHSFADDDILSPSIFDCFANCHEYLHRLQRLSDKGVIPSHLAERYQNRQIRIAIIDNGADKIRTTLSKNIEKGCSFVYHGSGASKRWLPWWVVAEPRGTQMASVIRRVNPHSRLLIARVGEGRKDIRPLSAAKAVEWAVAHDVHIISISWFLRTDEKELKDAIANAIRHRILVFASTADEGAAETTVWPASYPGVIRVSASDRYAHPMLASDPNVDVMVNGEDIAADYPSYVKNYKHKDISGSSVATAVAAAIASLALFLKEISSDDRAELRNLCEKDEILRVIFSKMGKGGRAIQPSKLFSEGFGTDDKNMMAPGWTSMFNDLTSENAPTGLSSSDDDEIGM